MVGTQDLFLACRIVGGAAGVLDEGTTAGPAAETLLALPGVSVSNGVAAAAMAALGSSGYFVFHHAPQCTQQHQRNHYPQATGTEEERLRLFRRVRDEIRERIEGELCCWRRSSGSSSRHPDEVPLFRVSGAFRAPENDGRAVLCL